MPDKLLKDGLRTSAKIGAVSEFAELLFVRLILATCHAGRCPWNLDWIRTHALPNRRRKRLTEIAAALESLRRAHLVTRYTGPDGTAYLLIPNHGQRLSYRVRSPWPAPPSGPPDAEGQTFMAMPDAPLTMASQSEEKPKSSGGRAPPLLFSSTSSIARPRRQETEAEWLSRLAREWPDIDLPAELAAARKRKGSRLERGWFEQHWLPRCTEKVGATWASPAPTAPEGWRAALEQLFPGNTISSDPARTWASVAPSIRAQVEAHLKSCPAA